MPNTAIMTMTLRSALRAAAVVALCGGLVAWAPSRANADSGRLNLHVDLGAGIPIMGYLAPPGNNDLTARLGIGGWLSLDYVVAGPVALEVIGSAGYLLEMADGAPRDPSGDLALGRYDGSMMWMAGLGVRVRLIDPQDGYSNETNGDIAGGFLVSAHVGVHQFDGIQIGLDAALGYDLSIARPFSMGFFVRGYLLFAGDGKPASVIERAVSQWGLPNGYVLGEEGSGAFVAGLRYGEGTLYTKNAGDLRVYWQGPSVGFDWGGDGARTMVLVYNLPATDAIYQRFAGIDGSAYIIGGFGMTALTANGIVLVPIRSGVGLRLGANIGYLKFTPRATWNPF